MKWVKFKSLTRKWKIGTPFVFKGKLLVYNSVSKAERFRDALTGNTIAHLPSSFTPKPHDIVGKIDPSDMMTVKFGSLKPNQVFWCRCEDCEYYAGMSYTQYGEMFFDNDSYLVDHAISDLVWIVKPEVYDAIKGSAFDGVMEKSKKAKVETKRIGRVVTTALHQDDASKMPVWVSPSIVPVKKTEVSVSTWYSEISDREILEKYWDEIVALLERVYPNLVSKRYDTRGMINGMSIPSRSCNQDPQNYMDYITKGYEKTIRSIINSYRIKVNNIEINVLRAKEISGHIQFRVTDFETNSASSSSINIEGTTETRAQIIAKLNRVLDEVGYPK